MNKIDKIDEIKLLIDNDSKDLNNYTVPVVAYLGFCPYFGEKYHDNRRIEQNTLDKATDKAYYDIYQQIKIVDLLIHYIAFSATKAM